MPASHPSFPLAANVSTRYLLRTDDGVFIQVQTRGWRTGPKDVLQRLSDAAREGFTGVAPEPTEYKFRLEIEMETDATNEKYAWLNTAMWIGAGVRSGRQGTFSGDKHSRLGALPRRLTLSSYVAQSYTTRTLCSKFARVV